MAEHASLSPDAERIRGVLRDSQGHNLIRIAFVSPTSAVLERLVGPARMPQPKEDRLTGALLARAANELIAVGAAVRNGDVVTLTRIGRTAA